MMPCHLTLAIMYRCLIIVGLGPIVTNVSTQLRPDLSSKTSLGYLSELFLGSGLITSKSSVLDRIVRSVRPQIQRCIRALKIHGFHSSRTTGQCPRVLGASTLNDTIRAHTQHSSASPHRPSSPTSILQVQQTSLLESLLSPSPGTLSSQILIANVFLLLEH